MSRLQPRPELLAHSSPDASPDREGGVVPNRLPLNPANLSRTQSADRTQSVGRSQSASQRLWGRQSWLPPAFLAGVGGASSPRHAGRKPGGRLKALPHKSAVDFHGARPDTPGLTYAASIPYDTGVIIHVCKRLQH